MLDVPRLAQWERSAKARVGQLRWWLSQTPALWLSSPSIIDRRPAAAWNDAHCERASTRSDERRHDRGRLALMVRSGRAPGRLPARSAGPARAGLRAAGHGARRRASRLGVGHARGARRGSARRLRGSAGARGAVHDRRPALRAAGSPARLRVDRRQSEGVLRLLGHHLAASGDSRRQPARSRKPVSRSTTPTSSAPSARASRFGARRRALARCCAAVGRADHCSPPACRSRAA
jgi:hypothetical protein